MGRGTGQPHTKSTQQSTVPIVGMDYFYVTQEGVRRRDELAKELAEVLDQMHAPGSSLVREGQAIGDARADDEADASGRPAGLVPAGHRYLEE